MRSWKFLLPLLASTLCFAAQPDRITGTIDSSQMVTLPGRIHRMALPQYDQGPVDGSYQFTYVTMLFTPSAAQSEALDLLLAQQQDPASANYHKWLTPEQFADRFGLPAGDMKKVTDWLKSQGLQIVTVARGGQFVVFGGTAAQVENAFRTEFHHYNVNGEMHFANAIVPSIPAALSGVVGGFRGMDDFRLKPSLKRHPDYTLTGQRTHFIAPGDLYTIYDINSLQSAGIDGTGQKLAIIGQTDLLLTDINDYRTDFGLPAINLVQTLVPGTGDPGVVPGSKCPARSHPTPRSFSFMRDSRAAARASPPQHNMPSTTLWPPSSASATVNVSSTMPALRPRPFPPRTCSTSRRPRRESRFSQLPATTAPQFATLMTP
jgi:hypothetical protein